ncbi:hypothetical protein KZZ52_35940 [Dactylosporangium sp. AC04546]|uniref:hypothetical protein n=1 Tax=Dactylosporangium sp. AC04546 TaxID=2862460 RepID=UPI001EE152F4|nr:hypothetical protein [Dactylosporangium sp. AC04546]WVK79360.1 hypothetical protein KZZ52_35940 [Dactylosporangium sp. AC04546]
MLTASVNLVQSAFPDRDQGDISGLSRSVSNLGSSLGTALVGSVIVAATHPTGRTPRRWRSWSSSPCSAWSWHSCCPGHPTPSSRREPDHRASGR